jgi:hypothetical protein
MIGRTAAPARESRVHQEKPRDQAPTYRGKDFRLENETAKIGLYPKRIQATWDGYVSGKTKLPNAQEP